MKSIILGLFLVILCSMILSVITNLKIMLMIVILVFLHIQFIYFPYIHKSGKH